MKKHIELQSQGHTMRGYLQGEGNHVLVMFHGYTGSKTEAGQLFKDIANQLEAKGIATLRMDFFGHGESDVAFEDLRVPMLQAQGKAIIDYAHTQFETVNLLGFSMGGFLAMDQLDDDIHKLILLAPATQMGNMENHEFSGIEENTKDLGGIVLHREFLKGFKEVRGVAKIKAYSNPILILQGQDDTAVPMKNSVMLKNSLPNAKIHVFGEADHCFSKQRYHNQLADVIATFLNE